MKPRFNYAASSPGIMKGMMALEEHLHHCSLEIPLVHLVKLRASQINECAYCIDMHWKDLRALGEPEQRLYSLNAWRECPWYTERERAALAWTEAVTLVAQGQVPDAIYNEVRPHFNDMELTDLTCVIATINAWNRFSIAARTEPGTYAPKVRKATA